MLNRTLFHAVIQQLVSRIHTAICKYMVFLLP
nr:MAG TPA: hypothetical protein [Caudoviricetes sp.]